jgi:type IV secretion system protein TrbF
MGVPEMVGGGTEDPRFAKAFIARFVQDLRGITADRTLLKKQYERLYSMLDSSTAAYKTISNHFLNHDPFKRAEKESVTVELLSVIPQSDTTWEVEWREEAVTRNGEPLGRQIYRAYVQTFRREVKEEVDLLINPLGLMIESFQHTEKVL